MSSTSQTTNARLSRLPRKPPRPFISAHHRPPTRNHTSTDNIFRVLLISSGSVASIKIPNIVEELVKVTLFSFFSLIISGSSLIVDRFY